MKNVRFQKKFLLVWTKYSRKSIAKVSRQRHAFLQNYIVTLSNKKIQPNIHSNESFRTLYDPQSLNLTNKSIHIKTIFGYYYIWQSNVMNNDEYNMCIIKTNRYTFYRIWVDPWEKNYNFSLYLIYRKQLFRLSWQKVKIIIEWKRFENINSHAFYT